MEELDRLMIICQDPNHGLDFQQDSQRHMVFKLKEMSEGSDGQRLSKKDDCADHMVKIVTTWSS